MTDDLNRLFDQKPAEPLVRDFNTRQLSELPFADRQDFTDADRGFIATLPEAEVRMPEGREVWSMRDYAFLKSDEVPDSVNPSLWRQAQLNCRHGLFEVVPGVYQIRGFDLSNMTIIEGDSGVIVIDPLVTKQVAEAGLKLYRAHRGERPVKCVIYTHSHSDHWGGVKGVVDVADVEAGKVPVIAPEGFLEAVASENVLAGPAMGRRALYQFGRLLPKGIRGQVDAGLGKTSSAGTVTLIAPTDLITRDHETRTVDGVEIIFLMAPDSEAPAEFHMYYPKFRVLNMAENAVHNFHNLLPFRGTEVRDSRAWSHYIDVALEAFGPRTDALIGQHHWPVWETDRITDYLKIQRDLYKYVHDQSLRLINLGYTPNEISEELQLPKTICCAWHSRGYYGTLRHNAKAVYQRYIGWYDANPANLDPLPPVEAAKKYVAYMGGAGAAMTKARIDFEAGEYRWVAEAMKHVVFADPSNKQARALAADAFEQLGYLSEAATWRNAYLYGAHELRHGPPAQMPRAPVPPEALRAISLDAYFDFWGVRLNGPKAEGLHIVLNWSFTDTKQVYVLNLENSALTHRTGALFDGAHATVTLARKTLDSITLFETTFEKEIAAGRIRITGDASQVHSLLGLLDTFDSKFAIVEP